MESGIYSWRIACVITLLVLSVFGSIAVEGAGTTLRHPNLLLNQEEIDEVKLKIQDHPWASRLLDRVKKKAEKNHAPLESAGAPRIVTCRIKAQADLPKKTALTAYLPTIPTVGNGQAAVHFPMKSGDEVSLRFTRAEELPR